MYPFSELPHSNTALLTYAAVMVLALVTLIVRFKISAFIALTVASICLGLVAGLAPSATLKAFQDGVGGVLASITLVIALGTILGKILGETRAAEVIAVRLVELFGPKRLPFAFFVVGFIVGLPVFFAVGIVLVAPILYATCKGHNLSMIRLGLPMVAGLSGAHGLIPPHPGPLAAIELLHANIGMTILYSIPIALVAGVIGGPILFRFLPLPTDLRAPILDISKAEGPLPSFASALGAILLPIVLIAASSVSDVLLERNNPLRSVFTLLGHPISALLAGVFFAIFTLARRFSGAQLLKMSESSLGPVAIVLLVIGAGAGFSRVLIESGVGKAVAEIATRWSLPAVPMGFALAALIRVATGSATVSITTAAGLVKPIADAQPGTNLELLVLAMGSGSLLLSHVNDGGFWLVKEYLNLSVPEALRTWTVLETVMAVIAFGCVLLLDLFF
jgi:GntP family gluconate:H+ symporter